MSRNDISSLDVAVTEIAWEVCRRAPSEQDKRMVESLFLAYRDHITGHANIKSSDLTKSAMFIGNSLGITSYTAAARSSVRHKRQLSPAWTTPQSKRQRAYGSVKRQHEDIDALADELSAKLVIESVKASARVLNRVVAGVMETETGVKIPQVMEYIGELTPHEADVLGAGLKEYASGKLELDMAKLTFRQLPEILWRALVKGFRAFMFLLWNAAKISWNVLKKTGGIARWVVRDVRTATAVLSIAFSGRNYIMFGPRFKRVRQAAADVARSPSVAAISAVGRELYIVISGAESHSEALISILQFESIISVLRTLGTAHAQGNLEELVQELAHYLVPIQRLPLLYRVPVEVMMTNFIHIMSLAGVEAQKLVMNGPDATEDVTTVARIVRGVLKIVAVSVVGRKMGGGYTGLSLGLIMATSLQQPQMLLSG